MIPPQPKFQLARTPPPGNRNDDGVKANVSTNVSFVFVASSNNNEMNSEPTSILFIYRSKH